MGLQCYCTCWSFGLAIPQKFSTWRDFLQLLNIWYINMYTVCFGYSKIIMIKTYSALLAICEGNHRSPVDFPHKGQWRRALTFSLICARTNGWTNNRDAGDFRRHGAHCDVTVMGQFMVSPHWNGKCHQADEISASGCTGSCENDIFRYN